MISMEVEVNQLTKICCMLEAKYSNRPLSGTYIYIAFFKWFHQTLGGDIQCIREIERRRTNLNSPLPNCSLKLIHLADCCRELCSTCNLLSRLSWIPTFIELGIVTNTFHAPNIDDLIIVLKFQDGDLNNLTEVLNSASLFIYTTSLIKAIFYLTVEMGFSVIMALKSIHVMTNQDF